jgi:hypothetical protein
MPAGEFLKLEGHFERQLWISIAERTMEIQSNVLDVNRARQIANAVIKGLGGK